MSHFESFESWRAEKASHFESFRGWRRDKASHFESSGDFRLREVSHGESFGGCRLREVSHGVGLGPDGFWHGAVLASVGVFAVSGLGHGASRAVGRGWSCGRTGPLGSMVGRRHEAWQGAGVINQGFVSGSRARFRPVAGWLWIPACAGVTNRRRGVRVPRESR